jgi:methionyl aminopeptidase
MLKSNDPCWCGTGKKFKRCHGSGQQRLRPGRLAPTRPVPDSIPRPDYADSGQPRRWDEPRVKSPEVIERMRRAGRAAAEILQLAGAEVAPGVTTDHIDRVVHEACIERGGYPSPLNYRGFPKSVCTSINEVICHGIPDDRPLQDGDICNIDVTIFLDGVHGDTNATFLVGDVNPACRRLVRVTRECMERGIDAVMPGQSLSEIGRAIESHATAHGYEVVRAFVGHGIGEQFHTNLQIPHYHEPRLGTLIEEGMTFTIEPMISIGTGNHDLWDDGWTAVTTDASPTAQFEHTILVTAQGAEVLTTVGDREPAG